MHQQVMPPLTRICCVIAGISLTYMAECFGIDPSRYKSMGTRNHDNDDDKYMASFTEAREEIRHDKNVEIKVSCSKCGENWTIKGLLHQDTQTLALGCLKCGEKVDYKTVLNKLQIILRNQFKAYYQNRRTCHTCASQTHAVYLTDKRCRTCEEEFTIDYSEKHILDNIKYLRSVFDTSRIPPLFLNKLDRLDVDYFNQIKMFIEGTVLKKCEYDKVNLKSLFSFMPKNKARS